MTAGPYKFINVQNEDGLSLLCINRPECSNALNAESQREMESFFDDFQADPNQLVAIITGTGSKAFCAGMDLKAVASGDRSERRLPLSGFGGLTYRFNLDKPVIAAVNGACVGGGFELALSCDIIIASDGARFGFPEPKHGTAALAGGMQRLARQIGLKRAMDLILTARLIDAQQGAAMGFVNEVVPTKTLLDVARRRALQILALDPLAVRASKRCVMDGIDIASLEVAIDHQLKLPQVKALLRSASHAEGPGVFVRAKRDKNDNLPRA
jgi:acetyl-CoA C-acetyltransferase